MLNHAAITFTHNHFNSLLSAIQLLQTIYMLIDPSWLSRYDDGLRAERPEFDYRQRQEMFLYSTAFPGITAAAS
jgi:hypothetical protein